MQVPSKTLDHAAPFATHLVSVAGSAGAFVVLRDLLSWMEDVPAAAIAVAVHGHGHTFVDALSRRSRVPVCWAASGDVLRGSRVYAPPPSFHLIVNPDRRCALSSAPPVRRFRPSCDWLFESGAAAFEDRHVAVVLSGMLTDGVRALPSVKRRGGIVFAQDPATCQYADMPLAAIGSGLVDAVLPVHAMPAALTRLIAARDTQADLRAWDDPFFARA